MICVVQFVVKGKIKKVLSSGGLPPAGRCAIIVPEREGRAMYRIFIVEDDAAIAQAVCE